MNYLAHLHLADHTHTSPLGNLLGDFVKGPLAGDLSPELRLGIRLHRTIDGFTDNHPEHRAAVASLSPPWRRYGPILIDMLYDHWLSRHWTRFAADPLPAFLARHYRALLTVRPHHPGHLPAGLPLPLRHMAEQGWLESYAECEGTARALDGIGRRLRRPLPLGEGVRDLSLPHRGEMEQGFLRFYPDLMAFALDEAKRLKREEAG